MAGGLGNDTPHLPTPAPIDAYGNGGFRFGGMSHRGSLICFPDGMWAWPVASIKDVTAETLAQAFARGEALDVFLIGAGRDPAFLPPALRSMFHDLSISVDVMTTGAAVRTYNVLLAENRRAGAGLIAVE
ncbi:Mth938-like domain-containing protein [Pseudolabrys sp. FHR47]|uniref:Mth938-like domain-containing protein n=1 Tax=Pseudolabrys sp. FHR47 TaxID=2562284 RepID=UPI0010BE4217|nr:MTH938/NDUFAF3 family protein [Pseudolabrys sp. FHR47]